MDYSTLCEQNQVEDGDTRAEEPVVDQVFDQEHSITDETLDLSTLKVRTRSKSTKYNIQQAINPSDSETEDKIPRHAVRELNVDPALSALISTLNSYAEARNDSQVPARSFSPKGDGLAAASRSNLIKTIRRCRALHHSSIGNFHRANFFRVHQPADQIDEYDIRRGCVGMCDPEAGDCHEDSLPCDIVRAEGG